MAYMVRQSIMDKEQNVLGYEMRYYDETAGTTDNENTAANAVSNILTQLGDQNITDDKPVFLNFTWNLLQRKVPEMFNTENLIMIVEDSIIIDPKSTETMLEYKRQATRSQLPISFSCPDISAYWTALTISV